MNKEPYLGLLFVFVLSSIILITLWACTDDSNDEDAILIEYDNVLKFETRIQIGDDGTIADIDDCYDVIPCDGKTLYYDKDTNTVIAPSGTWTLTEINGCYYRYTKTQERE